AVAEHGPFSDAADKLCLGDGDGVTLPSVHMQHHEQVRAAVTHVDCMIWRYLELGFQFLQNSNFAIPRGNAINRRNFATRSMYLSCVPKMWSAGTIPPRAD